MEILPRLLFTWKQTCLSMRLAHLGRARFRGENPLARRDAGLHPEGSDASRRANFFLQSRNEDVQSPDVGYRRGLRETHLIDLPLAKSARDLFVQGIE
jgi:hypothetical protein